MKKTALLMGKGSLAVKVAQWLYTSSEYDLRFVIPNTPESSWAPSLRDWAKDKNVTVIESGHFKDLPNVEEAQWHVDFAISVTYDKIIRDWFIKKCGKIVNIHNGPLPRYRGVNPINWALTHREPEHGVTIHEITPGIDDGPIVSQVRFPVNPEIDEVIDVYERSLHFGWKLFKETMPRIWEIVPQPQDESLATYFSSKDFDALGDRKYFTREQS